MALVVKDRVKETTTTTGTGTLTLAGVASGFQSFSVIGDGNTTYYTIDGGTEWEVGVGTYTSSGTTLSRDTILESSNGGTAVNFSAGTKNVFVTYPAEKSVSFDSGTSMLFAQTSAPVGWTKSTTHNDKALRVVSGTASSGGSVAFTTAFASQTPSGTVSVSVSAGTLAVGIGTLVSDAFTLTTTEIPSHTHSPQVLTSRFGSTQSSAAGYSRDAQSQAYTPPNVSSTGGGSSHTHTLTGSPSLSGSPSVTSATFSGNAINLAVQYVDVIIATKD